MMCEKCWADAYTVSIMTGECQTRSYAHLVRSRTCTPREQAGHYWDEETQGDIRQADHGVVDREADLRIVDKATGVEIGERRGVGR